MSPARRVLAVVMAGALALPAGALPQEDPRSRIRATVELVVVPVTVKDGQGRLVHGIGRDEFRIFEDNVEQSIQLFSVDPFPLSAVVLIDNGLPLKTAKQVQRSAGAIAAGFSEFDEVAIGLFEAFYQPVCDFTPDNDKIYNHLKRLDLAGRFPGQGSPAMTAPPRVNTSPVEPGVPRTGPRADRKGKNLDDAIYAAALMLRARARDRRKIIFLVSDGANSRNNTFSFDDTLNALLSADISVYAVSVGDAVLSRIPNVLSRYARSTGGDVFYASTRAELENLYSGVTEQARNQYTLAYIPRQTDRSLEYHSIEVRVRRHQLTLLARDGYFRVAAP